MDQIRVILDEVLELIHNFQVPGCQFDLFNALPALLRRQLVVLILQDLTERKSQARQRAIPTDNLHEFKPKAWHDNSPAEVDLPQIFRLFDISRHEFERFRAVMHIDKSEGA